MQSSQLPPLMKVERAGAVARQAEMEYVRWVARWQTHCRQQTAKLYPGRYHRHLPVARAACIGAPDA